MTRADKGVDGRRGGWWLLLAAGLAAAAAIARRAPVRKRDFTEGSEGQPRGAPTGPSGISEGADPIRSVPVDGALLRSSDQIASAPAVIRWGVPALGGLVVRAMSTVLIFGVGPKFLPYQTHVVTSGSMAPAIPVGAVVFLDTAPASALAPGDVITFNLPGRTDGFVTHRIVRIEQTAGVWLFTTKGDADVTPATWRALATGVEWRHRFHVPYAGYVLAPFQSPFGGLALLAAPVFGLGLLILVGIWRPKRANSPLPEARGK